MRSLTTIPALFLALATLACGDIAPPVDDENPDDVVEPDPDPDPDPEPDTTAPSILSVSPASGSSGQYDDVVVSIGFSEPMDQASVEAALETGDLGESTISWNDDGDTVYITPNQPLAYAQGEGLDPSLFSANAYAVTLGTGAYDLAGNPLPEGITTKFSTLKAMGAVLYLDHDMTRSLVASGKTLYTTDDPLVVGDLATDHGVRALFTFDLSPLPDSAVAIDWATFATRQLPGDQTGLPYGDANIDDPGLGAAVLIDHVSYDGFDNAAYNASMSAHLAMGELCVDGQVVIEHDATDAVADDLAYRVDRGDVSQYLLRFDLDNDADGVQDRAVISRDLAELQLVYLAE